MSSFLRRTAFSQGLEAGGSGWQLEASGFKPYKRLTKTAKWSLIGAGIKEVLMGATPQNINDVRITIKDCRRCNAWDRINPVLNELYRICQAYNRDSHKICQSIEPDESAIREINAAQLHKQAAKAQALVNKLRGMGVHFVDLRSFDLFSKAFCQAMVMEFGEREMRVAAY